MSHQSYSLDEKELICNLLQKGHSVKDISEQLSIPIANIYIDGTVNLKMENR